MRSASTAAGAAAENTTADYCCRCAPLLSPTAKMRAPREIYTPELQPRPSVSSATGRLSLPMNKASSGIQSSGTWTSTSGELGALSDSDAIEDRESFVDEYNRLANKYGVRPLVPDDPESFEAVGISPKRNWWSRTFRRTSSQSTEHSVRRQRSISHVAVHMAHPKRDSLKDQDLQGLVRLCGKSFLYLPPEYAPGSLLLPTCFRATAQHLVQHAPETRGVFRIPGSVRVVNELYEFYCADQDGGNIANTVRSPNLPVHINPGIHDVASTFKKFLAGLPGGILGSLSLFDALVAINSQLYSDPEFSRTKQSKIRARLIALAIGTLRSQFRRELICAVFGLLCLLGRAAETAPREDDFGRPLPTSDLMGYNALGIVFGPLLVGGMLGSHAVKLADPSAGLFIVPISPQPKSKKERKKAKERNDEPSQAFLDVDRIHVANDITEMLITNWRDVVRQMRSMAGDMSVLRRRSRASISKDEPRGTIGLTRPSDRIDDSVEKSSIDKHIPEDRSHSPIASSSRPVYSKQMYSTDDELSVKKTRPKSGRSVPEMRRGPPINVLSPPKEEAVVEDQDNAAIKLPTPIKSALKSMSNLNPGSSANIAAASDENISLTNSKPASPLQSPSKSNNLYQSSTIAPEITPKRLAPLARADITGSEDSKFQPSQRRLSAVPSMAEKCPETPKPLAHGDGSLGRSKPSYDLAPILAHRSGARRLNAPSTVRSQPKMAHIDPDARSIKLRSSVQRTSSRGSVSSVSGDNQEPTNTSPSRLARHKTAPNQMDGTGDFILSGSPYHGSFQSLRGEFKRISTLDGKKSSIPILKSTPQLREPASDKKIHRTTSCTSPHKASPELTNGSRIVKPGRNKVKGLAAMFDTAAKTSPLVPASGGAAQKNRREAARVISPYTSNPSPHASLQSVTSVSSPVTLMSSSRNNMNLVGPTKGSVSKSLIPRRQVFDTSEASRKIDRQASPNLTRRDELHNPTTSFRAPSRLPTPSRLPVKKRTYTADTSGMVQLDGTPRAVKSPLKLTAQQEIRPVGFYSRPVLSHTNGGYKSVHSRLSQHSTGSWYSETESQSRDSISLSPSPGRGRSASSLRDQIRTLRSELSAKSKDYAKLRLELEELRKMKEVNETLLSEEIDRARADIAEWRGRAERAELKIDHYERAALRITDVGNDASGEDGYAEQCGQQEDDYSFMSGSDHIYVAESHLQPLAARINQDIRRTAYVIVEGGDGLSERSASTVVRNKTASSCDEDSTPNASGLWTALDELDELSSA